MVRIHFGRFDMAIIGLCYVGWFATASFGMQAVAAFEPAMKGYCPVSYFTSGKPTEGNPSIQAPYAGSTYFFVSEDAKKLFIENPTKFLPQFDGVCTTALGGSYGNRLPSDPKVFDVRNGKLYLFGSERAKMSYDKNPESYIAQGEARFSKAAVGGHCLVSSKRTGKPVEGVAAHSAPFRGWLYHFANAEARTEFLKDPQVYMTQFDNLCTAGVAAGKRYPANGSRLRVINGKIYLLFDGDAEKAFDADPSGTIAKAEATWPTIKDQK